MVSGRATNAGERGTAGSSPIIPASADRAVSLRCNAPQRAPRFRDTAWGRLRRQTGWSLRELAELTGVNLGNLSRIEAGQAPTPRQARQILAAYDAAIGAEAVDR